MGNQASKEILASKEISISINRKLDPNIWALFIIYEINKILEAEDEEEIDMSLNIDAESDIDRIFIGDGWTIRLWNITPLKDEFGKSKGLCFRVSLFKDKAAAELEKKRNEEKKKISDDERNERNEREAELLHEMAKSIVARSFQKKSVFKKR